MGSRGITRRDFLDGTRIAITGAALARLGPLAGALGGCAEPAAETAPGAYPPALTGLRGSHDGSFEVAHALVAGQPFPLDGTDTGERFALVVVGGGISGLAAAHFYRKSRPGARVLVIDNHDDFGGHAKRNEFDVSGRTRLGYGGTQSIDSPSAWSPVAKGLLRDLGVDVQVFHGAFDAELYESLGLGEGIFFDRETFGSDQLAAGYGSLPWPEFAARTPLSERARADLVRLHTEERDYLPGLSRDEKAALLRRTSYEEFLRDRAGMDPAVLAMYRRLWLSYFAVGADSYPATWVAREPEFMPGLLHTFVDRRHAEEDPYIFHFPDGNASIARLLVRGLVPGAVPGSSMQDVVTAKVDYGSPDAPGAAVAIRLRATAVAARNLPDGSAVVVGYAREGRVHSVRAEHCVLACWNAVVPHLCPDLPDAQKRGLVYGVKAPLVYVNAVVRSWRAFEKLGVHVIHAPGSFYAWTALDFPVSMGDYACARSPDEPMVVHLDHVPYHPEETGFEQWRAGRRELLAAPFAHYEAKLVDQLDRMLGPGGFDAGRDLLAITVNRWPHGYSYEPNTLWDPEWRDESELPWVIGRRRHGRIAIANADAGASAYTDCAIDQAHRAVAELLAA
jgi:spermidine dehydrogenase